MSDRYDEETELFDKYTEEPGDLSGYDNTEYLDEQGKAAVDQPQIKIFGNSKQEDQELYGRLSQSGKFSQDQIKKIFESRNALQRQQLIADEQAKRSSELSKADLLKVALNRSLHPNQRTTAARKVMPDIDSADDPYFTKNAKNFMQTLADDNMSRKDRDEAIKLYEQDMEDRVSTQSQAPGYTFKDASQGGRRGISKTGSNLPAGADVLDKSDEFIRDARPAETTGIVNEPLEREPGRFYPTPKRSPELERKIARDTALKDIEKRELSTKFRRRRGEITPSEASQEMRNHSAERRAILGGGVRQGRLSLGQARLAQDKVRDERKASIQEKRLGQSERKLIADLRDKSRKGGLKEKSLNDYAKNIQDTFFGDLTAPDDDATFKAWRRYMDVTRNMSEGERKKVYNALSSRIDAPPDVLVRATPSFFPTAGKSVRKTAPLDSATFQSSNAKALMLKVKTTFEQEKGRSITESDLPELRKRALALRARLAQGG